MLSGYCKFKIYPPKITPLKIKNLPSNRLSSEPNKNASKPQ